MLFWLICKTGSSRQDGHSSAENRQKFVASCEKETANKKSHWIEAMVIYNLNHNDSFFLEKRIPISSVGT